MTRNNISQLPPLTKLSKNVWPFNSPHTWHIVQPLSTSVPMNRPQYLQIPNYALYYTHFKLAFAPVPVHTHSKLTSAPFPDHTFPEPCTLALHETTISNFVLADDTAPGTISKYDNSDDKYAAHIL